MKAPNLSLYHFDSCPYCQRVRSAMRRLEIEAEMRDILTTPSFAQELSAATGTSMVPCLRIDEPGKPPRWMHESLDIIAYLEKEVAPRR
jgi:glutathione S-transferase